MALITTFPSHEEFKKAAAMLDRSAAPYQIISPQKGYAAVGIPAIVIADQDRCLFGMPDGLRIIPAGWVEFRESTRKVPDVEPATYSNDVFGTTAIMVLQPCIADPDKLRAIAHISGDLAKVFPYMNAVRKDAFYNVDGPTFTFMDQYRMISLYPSRIAMAKVDDMIDIWRTLESLRAFSNDCWQNHESIEPSFVLRKKPAALEIFVRLPRTDCGMCGEKTCIAFALRLWSGQISLFQCKPVFGGGYVHLKEPLFEICAGLGIDRGSTYGT
jgi:ArsR family metal-binding transcriptional regulator